MELTWLVATAIMLTAGSVVAARHAPLPGFVRWGLLCASLFALATRDLFRTREDGRAGPPPSESRVTAAQSGARTDRVADDRRSRPLFARLRSRVAGWLAGLTRE